MTQVEFDPMLTNRNQLGETIALGNILFSVSNALLEDMRGHAIKVDGLAPTIVSAKFDGARTGSRSKPLYDRTDFFINCARISPASR